jgi:phosphoribosylamine--glycine ligase
VRILVIGSGGREHALCWKIAQSPLCDELYCAPGNPGIAELAALVPIAADEIHGLADFAASLSIDLTVVGPELPLTLGLADEFARRGLAIFGPRQAAAELEGSKVFAKEFMARHGIPTAEFTIAHDAATARRAALALGFPVVLKADGLAAGKGVVLPADEAELDLELAAFFEERRFGAAGDRVVVERFLPGEEVSVMALSDGTNLVPLPSAKDYKRIGDGDTGPNTGGMGAHSPSGVLSTELAGAIVETVLRPTIAGLGAENRPFVGVLYAGIMLTPEGPRVLEFNVRLGDPEAQALLLRIEDDLVPVLAAAAAGDFGGRKLRIRSERAACLVLAAAGYPGKPVTGDAIEGIAQARRHPGVEVFHGGTAWSGEGADRCLVTHGGRVLNVCATGAELVDALKSAYAAAAEIRFEGKTLRRDIGRRVLEATSS